jgi:hypothetical protein
MSPMRYVETKAVPSWRQRFGFTEFGDFPSNNGFRYVPYGGMNESKNPYADTSTAAVRRERLGDIQEVSPVPAQSFGRIDESRGVEKVYDASERGITQTLHPTLRTIKGLAGFGDLLSDPVGTVKTFWANHPIWSLIIGGTILGLSTGVLQEFVERNFPED